MKLTARYLLPFILCCLPIQACAQEDFKIGFPVDCQIGSTCWVMNYIDFDEQDGSIKDPNCSVRSYDGHKGTDIAIRDWAEAERGVDVVALAPGTVTARRDGEADSFKTDAQIAAVKARSKDCGNGVIIDHGNGWTSQYCHMKNGSVSVAKGDKLDLGDMIGQVGMSGVTAHPHLHITLRKDGQLIDPYSGRSIAEKCGLETRAPLWSGAVPYSGFDIYDAGFLSGPANADDISKGERGQIPNAGSPALVFYMTYFGPRKDDVVTLEIKRPDGSVFSRKENVLSKDRARQNYYIGRKNSKGRFMAGNWTATATVVRKTSGEQKTMVRELIISE